jgi:hypothetical protein
MKGFPLASSPAYEWLHSAYVLRSVDCKPLKTEYFSLSLSQKNSKKPKTGGSATWDGHAGAAFDWARKEEGDWSKYVG